MNKNIKKTSMAIVAATAAAVMALAGCGSSGSASGDSSAAAKKTDTFVLGGLWPETGSLAYLAPPELAAEKLAVSDINAAGGVLGKDITTVDADTSDADHADQNSSATQSVMSKNPSFVIGPASSSVVKNVYKTITSANVPMLSMGATSSDFSGLSPYFFRTVPPDSVQGAVLGQVIAQDGVKNLAVAVFNDEYGTGLRDTIVKTVEGAGVNVVYGADSAFDPTETNFSSIVTAIKASNPDAIAIVAFDQTKSLVKELASQGVDTHKLYFVDGNTADYSKDLDAGLLEGAKGTIPGVMASDEFQKKLVKAYGKDISTFTYGAETYDGIILAALAAQKGGSADGATIQKNMAAVSGANGGTKCSTYKDCVAALKSGKEITYKGLTGIGPFNKNNDPSSANIGVYVFDGQNVPKFDHTQEGKVPTD
ncbi:ABC transporter substrate-binding protein [Bifidobacterium cebidarum]|uniref:Branched-chain amino acid ABC transporter substrate-binding protein n=1 Tax=Bifidobacterium cebidarum TaxID=2650773 RepID=A0A6I1GDT6_9BIFI|nr:ABC transporter substrate-binding protein [Bifidobacterium cebidarum]KAB7788842.1 branched-chain amino acid ABC transporter substrate-binding protein [Bifidobacterium cebidarum]